MYKDVRVRFAPSPTGHLHIGGLRSAIFNWLFAKHNKGKFLIRIEDTDRERSTKEFESSIIDSFKWMNIESDEPLLIQSLRNNEHKKLIQKLVDEGKAYRCFCTHKIDYENSDESGGYSKYDRACLSREITQEDLTKPYAVRFKLPEFEFDTFKFQDLIYGEISFPIDQFDDFIIARSDGNPIYNFVVVADDIFQKINFVIRGQDHLVNTPKQIMLYEALGALVPSFAHLPLILGPSGAKLSKREAAVSVLSYMQEGFFPNALFNYLVRLGWSHGDKEVFNKDELIDLFKLEDVNRSGAIFDIKKLEWLNSVYIKEQAAEQIIEYISKWMNFNCKDQFSSWTNDQLVSLINLYKDRVKTLRELISILQELYKEPVSFNNDELLAWKNEQTINMLEMVEKEFSNLVSWDLESIKTSLQELGKRLNLKFPFIAKPIRLALTGKVDSPSIFELVYLLSKAEVLTRITRFKNFLR